MSEVSQDTFRRINCVICGLDLPLGDAQDTYGKHLREKHGLCHECSIGESEFCQERCKERGLFESRPTEATDANINERNPWPKPWRVRWQRGWEYDYEMRYDYYDTKEQAEANRPLAPHWIEHEPDVKKQKTKATDADIVERLRHRAACVRGVAYCPECDDDDILREAAYTIEHLEAAQSHSVDITITITIDGGTK